LGDIHVLINNAGVPHISPFYKTPPSTLKKVIDVSLMGSIYCTSAAINSIIKTRGMVIGISSIAGFAPLCGRTGMLPPNTVWSAFSVHCARNWLIRSPGDDCSCHLYSDQH
jgi:NADP-dependent 3-hydroxy acid dehydrogenase YdfG